MEEVLTLSDYEIERGKPMPSKNHAIVQANLLLAIQPRNPQFRILPELTIDFPVRDRVPDLAFYRQVEFTPGDDETAMTEMPLGLVEILSPSQSTSELMQKLKEYFGAGVQSYWIVLPDFLTVYVYYSPDDFEVFTKKETLTDKKLGIELNLGEIFK
ncbi:MAG: Uma2 family endonuclease [Saprospiraceae bacterium]|nr:Uma2 family endonuclease [Saprospiraceae bacterium]